MANAYYHSCNTNTYVKRILLLIAIAVLMASIIFSQSHGFGWAVGAGVSNYGHRESTDGYSTKGSYFVDLPDGRRQKVTYYVSGDSGYVAEVSYEGAPHYHAPKPAYYKPVTAYKPAAHTHVHARNHLVSSAHLPSPFHG